MAEITVGRRECVLACPDRSQGERRRPQPVINVTAKCRLPRHSGRMRNYLAKRAHAKRRCQTVPIVSTYCERNNKRLDRLLHEHSALCPKSMLQQQWTLCTAKRMKHLYMSFAFCPAPNLLSACAACRRAKDRVVQPTLPW